MYTNQISPHILLLRTALKPWQKWGLQDQKIAENPNAKKNVIVSVSNTFNDLIFFSNATCSKISLIVLFANYSMIKPHENDLMCIQNISLPGF